MPPIGQQGSRGGLITAMVIFAILFLTSAIFAIYFNANMRTFEQKLTQVENKYKKIVSNEQINNESELGTAVTKMREERTALSDVNSVRAVDVLQARADELAKVITNGGGPGFTAAEAAKARVESTNLLLTKSGVTGI